jgi:D-3-phosphoglycerate dehydrogenase/C-terminal binding protein
VADSRSYSVIITDVFADALAPERQVLGDLAAVQALDAHSEQELAGRIEQADALIVCHLVTLSRETIAGLERCRVIVRAGVGYDNIDVEAARERGIPVVNVPDYCVEEVADSAIGLMLALTRGLSELNSRLRAGFPQWHHAPATPLYRLRGRTFGIVGLGRIGTATAMRARALGMDVVFYDPYKPGGAEKALGIRRADALEALLEQSFVLSLHCPLTPETRGMINAAALARLPRGAYLINTARGAVVETAAIPPAIASGQLAGAGIDVLEREPPPPDDPLLRAWRDPSHPAHHRVILTPHSAFYSEESLLELRREAAAACRDALLGVPLRNVVNGV